MDVHKSNWGSTCDIFRQIEPLDVVVDAVMLTAVSHIIIGVWKEQVELNAGALNPHTEAEYNGGLTSA